MCCNLHCHLQNTKGGNIFWKNDVYPFSISSRVFQSLLQQTLKLLWRLIVEQHLLTHWMGFTLICHPTVSEIIEVISRRQFLTVVMGMK